MRRVEREGASLQWDPAEGRLIVMRFERDAVTATEEAARALRQSFEEWLAQSPGFFHLLVDCGPLATTTPGWRAVWAPFFRQRRAECRIAWFRATPLLRVTIKMFRLATRVDGAAFESEAEARAWLGNAPPVAP